MMRTREWGKCRNCGVNYKRRATERNERMMLCLPCARRRWLDPELFDNALRRKEMVKRGLDKIAKMVSP